MAMLLLNQGYICVIGVWQGNTYQVNS